MRFLFRVPDSTGAADGAAFFFAQSGHATFCAGLEIEHVAHLDRMIVRPLTPDGLPSLDCYIEIPCDNNLLAEITQQIAQCANIGEKSE